MKLTWLGHSCFLIEHGDYQIVVDPYADQSVPGYSNLRIEVDDAYFSHDHADHYGIRCLSFKEPKRESPIHVSFVPSFHDNQNGRMRGSNRIHIFEVEQKKVIHIGDIGHLVEDDRLMNADVMLVPVGGYYTLEPNDIYDLVMKYQPRVVIPMHYRFGSYGYPEIKTLDPFIEMCDNVVKYDSNTFIVSNHLEKQVAVLTYAERGNVE